MKKKLVTVAVVTVAAFTFTACQEDATLEEMDQLIQDAEMTGGSDSGNSNGTKGSGIGGY